MARHEMTDDKRERIGSPLYPGDAVTLPTKAEAFSTAILRFRSLEVQEVSS
jgi:hypothetical protein